MRLPSRCVLSAVCITLLAIGSVAGGHPPGDVAAEVSGLTGKDLVEFKANSVGKTSRPHSFKPIRHSTRIPGPIPTLTRRGDCLRRAGGVAHLVVGEQAALDQVVALAPVEEGLSADGVVVEGELRPARLGAGGEVAVHVALAEAGEGHAVLGGPAGEAAELDLVVALCLFGAGRPEVQEKLAEGLLPGERTREGPVGGGAGNGVRSGVGDKTVAICAHLAFLIMTLCH